jgi:hypothetical protein
MYYLSFLHIFVRMNFVCQLKTLPCEFGGHFWQEWDVHKIGGKLKGLP